MRVVVVGGGAIGMASALSLADRRVEVDVIERGALGGEASSAAAGILGAQIESHRDDALCSMLVEARSMFAPWSDELRDRTGIDIGYAKTGALRVALNANERAELAGDVNWQLERRWNVEWLDAEDARRLEPSLTDEVVRAAHFPDDGQVDPVRLVRALAIALERSPVRVHLGQNVRSLRIEHDRCVGVVLDREIVYANAVVVAAGAWTSQIHGMLHAAKVEPIRGQMLVLEERPLALGRILFGAGIYLVPRGDGRVLCGSTMENVGFQKGVTAEGMKRLLEGAMRIAPAMATANVTTMWSNFRPRGPVDAPLIGKTELPGLFVATGHFRNGILLSKLTAERIARAVTAP